jgi:DNA-binding LytR/AlgR family response regulator
MPTALIADDEPLLRERLAAHLQRLWPELGTPWQARNGREALVLFSEHTPDVVFLDVHMPGLTGLDAARAVAGRTQIVFVTAFEQYAVQAFEHGAVDYLVKPFDEARLASTVQRLKERLADRVPQASAGPPPAETAALNAVIDRLADQLGLRVPARPALQWIKASSGNTVKLIPVDELIFLRSDEKYTLVVWSGGEAVIRKSIKELGEELDPARFVQIHRSTIVNLHHVAQVVRGANETAEVHLRGRPEVLAVSRSFLHVFRQM